jgi:hypothetical protein
MNSLRNQRKVLLGERVEHLESALSGALKLGDMQAGELARLSQVSSRQRRVLWRAFSLLRQGRYDDAIVALEAECSELCDREAAR